MWNFFLFLFSSLFVRDECVFESMLFRYHLLPSKKEDILNQIWYMGKNFHMTMRFMKMSVFSITLFFTVTFVIYKTQWIFWQLCVSVYRLYIWPRQVSRLRPLALNSSLTSHWISKCMIWGFFCFSSYHLMVQGQGIDRLKKDAVVQV